MVTADFILIGNKYSPVGYFFRIIEQDPQLKHEILAYFYQYKSKKDRRDNA